MCMSENKYKRMSRPFALHSVKMSSRLKKYFAKLKLLKKATSKVRKNILKNCNRNLLCCLCECAKNVLKGNVPMTKPQKCKLRRFKKKLRNLVSKKTRVTIKKKIIQSGGFIGALLTPVLSFLGSLLNTNQ